MNHKETGVFFKYVIAFLKKYSYKTKEELKKDILYFKMTREQQEYIDQYIYGREDMRAIHKRKGKPEVKPKQGELFK